jgi:hypothetical protein
VTEGNPKGGGILFPIEFDGQKKWVSSVLVKEAPTAVKGVINTFLPKKLKAFQFSENFAAWKNVGPVDEWGNFTLSGLNLAEGQNVIAFDAESWTGNKSNQHLKIILNTIPFQPSNLKPLPGTHTNNNQPTFSGEFSQSVYSADAIKDIGLLSAVLRCGSIEADVKGKMRTRIEGGDYDKHLIFEFTPDEPLPDGEYTLIVVATSNVGISQAVIPVTIDTTVLSAV